MRRSRVFLVLFALAAALLSWHPAQAQKITGTITGTVTDSSGAAVSGATVTITNTATNKVQTATTDAQGGYTFAELPESTYTVEIKATQLQRSELVFIASNRSFLARGERPRRLRPEPEEPHHGSLHAGHMVEPGLQRWLLG